MYFRLNGHCSSRSSSVVTDRLEHLLFGAGASLYRGSNSVLASELEFFDAAHRGGPGIVAEFISKGDRTIAKAEHGECHNGWSRKRGGKEAGVRE